MIFLVYFASGISIAYVLYMIKTSHVYPILVILTVSMFGIVFEIENNKRKKYLEENKFVLWFQFENHCKDLNGDIIVAKPRNMNYKHLCSYHGNIESFYVFWVNRYKNKGK